MLGEFLADALRGLSPAAIALAALVVFGAAFLRGFTGFGFALAAVPALTLLLEPAVVVPCSLVLGLIVGTQGLAKLSRLVHWRAVWVLLVGSLIGTPPGFYLLGALPANTMRLGIGLVVVASVALLWRQPRLLHSQALSFGLGAGFLSGLLNGSTGMGGPPVVLYFLNSIEAIAVARASLVMFFFFSSLGTVAYGALSGFIDRHVLLLSLVFIPPLYLGNWLGDRAFDGSSAAGYRRIALGALLLLALVAVGRAAVDL